MSPSPPESAATANLPLTQPDDGSVDATPPQRPSHSLLRRLTVPWGIVIVLGFVIAVVVRLFVFQLYYVPSASMYPTIKTGDRILVDKLAFHLHPVNRGDIIVFRTPPTEHCGGPPVPDLVKRVIGLPGETISGRDGHVYIDGKRLDEPWLPKAKSTFTGNFGPVEIPDGDYFMMGDNRVVSCDSRYWGPIKGSTIVGEVVMRIWPLSSIKFF